MQHHESSGNKSWEARQLALPKELREYLALHVSRQSSSNLPAAPSERFSWNEE
jgi:hypothetical protein